MNDEVVVDQVLSDAVTGEETQQTEKTPEQISIEKEARSQGWAPKEEFRGKESDWIDADVFVQRGREINPILRENNKRIQKELDKAKADLESLKISAEEFKKFLKESTDKKLASYETELLSLREQKKQAISSGDGELAVQLDDQMDAVKEAKAAAKEEAKEKPKPEEKPQEINPKIQAWVEENSWYNSSKAMMATTNALAEEIRGKNPFFNEDQFLAALDKELEETFTPEKLGRKTKARNPMDVGTSTTSKSGGGKQGYDSLPSEAKKACDDFLKSGLIKSKEEYVRDYYA